MADTATEFDALLGIIDDEAKELRGLNPEHELLRFLNPILGSAEWPEEIHAEFLARFDPEDKLTVVKVRVAYLVAIRRALGRVPEVQPVATPAPPDSDIAAEDIPF